MSTVYLYVIDLIEKRIWQRQKERKWVWKKQYLFFKKKITIRAFDKRLYWRFMIYQLHYCSFWFCLRLWWSQLSKSYALHQTYHRAADLRRQSQCKPYRLCRRAYLNRNWSCYRIMSFVNRFDFGMLRMWNLCDRDSQCLWLIILALDWDSVNRWKCLC